MHFEAKRANGQFARWPSSGEIGLGFDTSCWNLWQTAGGTTPTTNSSPTSTTPTTVKPNPGDAPVVAIQSPAGGVMRGAVTIKATATDDVKVKAMEVWVDGKRLLRRNGASITRQWMANRSAVKSGPHTITVTAFDDNDHVGTKSLTVTK